jgi:hypothetical protein
VDEGGMWARYAKWGGIPRYVLQKLLPSDQGQLDTAITTIDLDRLSYVLQEGVIESDVAVSHRLFHLKPRGETEDGFISPTQLESYSLARMELGSPHIINAVLKAMQSKATSRLHELLAVSLDAHPTLAKLYGDLYQHKALDALAEGGTFQCFNLTDMKAADSIVLPACQKVFFKSASHLRREVKVHSESLETTIFVPQPSNYSGLDAVLPGSRLINFTVNLDHDLKLQHATQKEGVVPVLAALNMLTATKVNFYWVMPKQRYDEARKKSHSVQVKGPDAVLTEYSNRLVFFALQVDFPWPQKEK